MEAGAPSVSPDRVGPGPASRAAAAILLAALVLAVYWPARSNGFVLFDDPVYVTENPMVREGLSRDGLLWAFNVGHAGNWHPLTWLSHMLDVELFGLDPGAHHRSSLLLHALNAALLLWFLSLLLSRGGPRVPAPGTTLFAAGFAAALWAVHPLRLESVAWVAERKDVLSTLFGLLALLAYLGYARRPSALRYLAVALCLALGLAAKPMLVSLPLLLLLLDVWPLRRINLGGERDINLGAGRDAGRKDLEPGTREAGRPGIGALLLEKAPLFVLAAASSWLTLAAQRVAGALGPLESIGAAGRLANAVVAYAAYLGSLVWPCRLSVLYPVPPEGWPAWQVAAAAALLALLSLAAAVLARRRPWVPVGWAWYVIALVPVSGLVQIGVQARADRYTYLPQIGLFVILAMGWLEWRGRGRSARAVLYASAPLLLAGAALCTMHQLGFWSDTTALFGRAAAVTRMNYQAHYVLSLESARQGRLAEAARLAHDATRMHPGLYKVHDHLGFCLAALGRTEEALGEIRTAIRLRPDYAWAHFNLGTVLLDAGRPEEALEPLERAVGLAPGLAEAHCNLGLALERTGRPDRATEAYRRALEIDRGLIQAYLNLASLLAGRGEAEMALKHLRLAEEARPDDPRPLLLGARIALARSDFAAARERCRRLARVDADLAGRLARSIDEAERAAGAGTQGPPS